MKEPSSETPRTRRPGRRAGTGQSPSADGPDSQPGRLRKWLFRIAAVCLAPLLFLLLLEAALTVFGYGVDTDFFEDIEGRQACTSNQRFGWQFFPRSVARTPAPFLIPASKPAKTYRIFVLGGSAAFGTPNNAYNLGRTLGVLLRARYPETRFEVVNAAMTAINSHVVRRIAQQCAEKEPDLFLIYMGHNEVIGPYGPGTVFAGFSPNLWAIRGGMWLRSTRTGQLLASWTGWGGAQEPIVSWKGMAMFTRHRLAADDPRLEGAYDHFRSNLQDILSAARGAGATAIVCTVATNLKDCPPFASAYRKSLSKLDKEKFDALYQAGRAMESKGRASEALDRYLLAEKMQAGYAELHFALGRQYLASGRADEARKQLTLARDLDALRFRADSRINDVIRDVASGRHGEGIHLVDAEKAIERSPRVQHDLCGGELLHEHVHLKFEGNYVIAWAILRKLDKILPQALRARLADPPKPDRCAELLALTSWDRRQVLAGIARMTARPPFTNQLDHAADQARRDQAVIALEKQRTAAAFRADLQLYRAAVKRDPDDLVLRNSFVQFLLAQGRPAEIGEHVRFLLDALPGNAQAHNSMGAFLGRQGEIDKAIEQFRKGLEILPDDPDLHMNLGVALARQGDLQEAEKHLSRTRAMRPDDTGAMRAMAELLLARQKPAEALDMLDQAVEINPYDVRAMVRAAAVCADIGRRDEAIRRCLKALESHPNNADVHNELGNALVRKGEIAAAAEHFRQALGPGADRPRVLMNLAGAQIILRRFDEAISTLTQAAQLEPDLPRVQGMLGWSWQMKGNLPSAMACYRKAVKLDPNDVASRSRLAGALVAQDRDAEAVEHFRGILAKQPNNAEARHEFGAALHRLGREPEAIEQLTAAVALKPTPPPLARLGWLLAKRGRDTEAIRHYRKALQLDPAWAPALEGLAWVLATSGSPALRNGPEALDLAMRACERTQFKSPRPLNALAAAFAEKAQFDQAVTTAGKALRLAEEAKEAKLARELKLRLALYRAHKPFRRAAATTGGAGGS